MATSYDSALPQPFECFSTLVDRHHGPAASFTEQEEYQLIYKLTKFTNSKPLDEKLWRKIRPTKASLKSHVRCGVAPRIRRDLWLTMMQVKDENVTLYSRAIGQPEQNETFEALQVPPGLPNFSQAPGFSSAHARLLYYLKISSPQILQQSLVSVLVQIFLHFLEEWECFVGILNVVQRQLWLDRNEVERKASILTLHKLIETNLNIDIFLLKPVGMGKEVYLHEFLSLWWLWPFVNASFWITVRVMDLYLLEGPKLLYRLALEALKTLFNNPQCETYRTSGIELNQIVLNFVSNFSPSERAQWINNALKIPHLSWNNIFKSWLTNISLVEKKHNSSTVKDVTANGGTTNSEVKKKKTFFVDPSSEILTKELSDTLVSWFPDWAIGDYLECIFRASKHGYNLRTLYHKCENEEYLILVIKSTKDAIFGAFIVSPLTDRRNNTFFGSGETFLYMLHPRSLCYEWTAESDLILRGNDEELIVGSGGGQFGLWLDGDLNRGSTATCLSYNNLPLTGSEIDFSCSAIEVFKVSTIN